ncbi:calcium-binding protein [Microvirga pudoricolor]|uniref:calcium-binding protein n=1 Tax=Microvirga pudoricolor TaxID=2778729 RepID=UPI0019516F43|nr:calcium-binding protein [Microvirga pudoricolor]MBM6593047.1 hypothetical protein [Microvirga pudoricolor]
MASTSSSRAPWSDWDRIFLGSETADQLLGTAGDDIMYGFGGNDGFWGYKGADYIVGGSGHDIVYYNASSTGVHVDLRSGKGYYGDAAGDILAEIEGVTGSRFDDTLIGGNGIANSPSGTYVLDGGVGNDKIYATPGMSTMLMGGSGIDYLQGNTADDRFYVDNAQDQVIDWTIGDGDTVFTTASFTLQPGQHLETIIATAYANLKIQGNEFSNTLVVDGNNQTLDGGAGSDMLESYYKSYGTIFQFTTGLSAFNVDTIPFFETKQTGMNDKIALARNVFLGCTGDSRGLSEDQFETGFQAEDSEDRIIYNPNTGALFYDRDGTGSMAAVKFAQLQTGLGLSGGDFILI